MKTKAFSHLLIPVFAIVFIVGIMVVLRPVKSSHSRSEKQMTAEELKQWFFQVTNIPADYSYKYLDTFKVTCDAESGEYAVANDRLIYMMDKSNKIKWSFNAAKYMEWDDFVLDTEITSMTYETNKVVFGCQFTNTLVFSFGKFFVGLDVKTGKPTPCGSD